MSWETPNNRTQSSLVVDWSRAEELCPGCSPQFDVQFARSKTNFVLMHQYSGFSSMERLVMCSCVCRHNDTGRYLVHDQTCMRWCSRHQRWEPVYQSMGIDPKAFDCGNS